jgi:HPt (histidine-containing phosphotransfer) domain-containing protein
MHKPNGLETSDSTVPPVGQPSFNRVAAQRPSAGGHGAAAAAPALAKSTLATKKMADDKARARTLARVQAVCEKLSTATEEVGSAIAKPVDLRSLARALEKWRNAPSGSGELSARTETVVNQTVFHEEELVARLMGDKHLASKIIGGFLDDAPRQLRILKKMLEEGDADGARRQAHSLKGAASTISADALRSLCSEAQEAAAAHELLRALSLLPQLEEQFELLKAALKKSGLWKQVSGGPLPCAH